MSGGRRPRLAAVVATLVVGGMLGGLALALRSSQHASRQLLEDRFQARAAQAARFVQTYTEEVLGRESRVAAQSLAPREGPELLEEYGHVAEAFDFTASVLLDADGRLVAVTPRDAALVGQDMSARYPHLRRALAGKPTVSNVVPSAAEHVPVVAFATPFETPRGRMVFSGAFAAAGTPLAPYLRDMSTLSGYQAFIYDQRESIAASNVVGRAPLTTLREQDPAMANAVHNAGRGSFRDRDGVDRYFATTTVHGTPWRVVASVPKAQLFSALRGPTQWVPWLVLGVLALLALPLTVIVLRYVAGRQSLAVLSSTDALTHLGNRRSMERHLEVFASRASREHRPWSVLMVDLDHFKRVNDTFGHQAGDHVLAKVAARMRSALRLGDEVGRWGGEEFLVVLGDTDEAAAAIVAERLRAACCPPIELDGGAMVQVTLSAGSATTIDASIAEMVAAADAALYEAKEAGRDRVRVGKPPSPVAMGAPAG